MYAVIFQAETGEQNDDYAETAMRLRKLAEEKYGCRSFISFSDEGRELSISYWNSLEEIERWKHDAEHQRAQEKGRRKWYRGYHIQVVEILKDYKG